MLHSTGEDQGPGPPPPEDGGAGRALRATQCHLSDPRPVARHEYAARAHFEDSEHMVGAVGAASAPPGVRCTWRHFLPPSGARVCPISCLSCDHGGYPQRSRAGLPGASLQGPGQCQGPRHLHSTLPSLSLPRKQAPGSPSEAQGGGSRNAWGQSPQSLRRSAGTKSASQPVLVSGQLGLSF